MAVSDKQKAWAQKHLAEKLDQIVVRPAKGTKERWREAADAAGMSMSRFIIEAVETAIRNQAEG